MFALRRILIISLILSLGVLAPKTLAQTGFNVVINQINDSEFPQVTAYVTVADVNGLPITNLPPEAFTAVEGNTPVSITVQSLADSSEPVVLAIALDLSGSMDTQALANLTAATNNLIDQLGPNDLVALIAFTDTVTILSEPTRDAAHLHEIVNNLRANGDTALWDAVHQAVDVLAVYPIGRRAILVVTDGRDTQSTLKLDQVIAEAARRSLPIFPIGFGNVDQANLQQLATLTGGTAFIHSDSSQLTPAFTDIIQLLHQQYMVSYTSTLEADGTIHPLAVRVQHAQVSQEAVHDFRTTPKAISIRLPNFTNGQTVGGQIHFTPELVAPAAIQTVTYWIDDQKLQAVALKPFDYTWQPNDLDLGRRTLKIEATDANHNTGTLQLTLQVVPAVAVTITAPLPSEAVGGWQTLVADVEALNAISSVDFQIDGKSVGVVTAPPYQLEWDSATVSPGDHTLSVIATDLANQSAKTHQVIHVVITSSSFVLFAVVGVILLAIGIIFPIALRRRRVRQQHSLVAQVPVGNSATPDAWLVLEKGPGAGQQWHLAGETRIGRQRAQNDVVLVSVEVSRRHALIQITGGQYTFVNLSQTVPARINGRGVTTPQVLANNDYIEIGPFTMRFVVSQS